MRASALLHAPAGQPRAFRPSRFLLLGGVATLAVLLKPHAAFADPHAVFYTDRGQEQLFYNVLAALNQADYVEPPASGATSGPGNIAAVREEGDVIAGLKPATNAEGQPVKGQVYQDPNERVPLPRVRVRAVTSDDGDVYFRELRYRKALSEDIRTQFATFSCAIQRQIYGDAVWQFCKSQQGSQGSPPT